MYVTLHICDIGSGWLIRADGGRGALKQVPVLGETAPSGGMAWIGREGAMPFPAAIWLCSEVICIQVEGLWLPGRLSSG